MGDALAALGRGLRRRALPAPPVEPAAGPPPPGAPDRAAQLEILTRVTTDDLLEAFGLARVALGRRLWLPLLRFPSRHFAEEIVAFDDLVGEGGFPAGAAAILGRHTGGIEVRGAERVPPNGPLLVVSNHPGLTDGHALFAALPRPDLRIVALDRLFLRVLPHTASRLLWVGRGPNERRALVRVVARELRAGRAVLLFPSGGIEPDPAVLPGAAAALARWSPSVEVFARLVPELRVLPVVVSGVLSPAALRHPVARLRRRRVDREKLAAALQLLFPHLRGVTVRVRFGTPIAAADLPAGALAAAVREEMRSLIAADGRRNAP